MLRVLLVSTETPRHDLLYPQLQAGISVPADRFVADCCAIWLRLAPSDCDELVAPGVTVRWR